MQFDVDDEDDSENKHHNHAALRDGPTQDAAQATSVSVCLPCDPLGYRLSYEEADAMQTL